MELERSSCTSLLACSDNSGLVSSAMGWFARIHIHTSEVMLHGAIPALIRMLARQVQREGVHDDMLCMLAYLASRSGLHAELTTMIS